MVLSAHRRRPQPVNIEEAQMTNRRKTISGERVVDPVCGVKVDRNASVLRANYLERTYFFCAPVCKRSFEADPQKYIGAAPKKKGIWGRYVDRLTKATGGKPPSCCG